jgi:hypothetical protein
LQFCIECGGVVIVKLGFVGKLNGSRESRRRHSSGLFSVLSFFVLLLLSACQLVSYSRWVIERVLQSARKKDDERKRRLLVGFCNKTRGRLAALLVAVRWAKDKENIVARASDVTVALSSLKVWFFLGFLYVFLFLSFSGILKRDMLACLESTPICETVYVLLCSTCSLQHVYFARFVDYILNPCMFGEWI